MWRFLAALQKCYQRPEHFIEDFGPDFGPDYARFSDKPDSVKDSRIQDEVELLIREMIPHKEADIFVKNGFVFVKVFGTEESEREFLTKNLSGSPGVRDVIIQFVDLS
jgi:hypothetical protein